jgi:hypothetical protein
MCYLIIFIFCQQAITIKGQLHVSTNTFVCHKTTASVQYVLAPKMPLHINLHTHASRADPVKRCCLVEGGDGGGGYVDQG